MLLTPWITGARLDLVSHQKENILEYRAIYFIQDLNGLGDKTKYFIDLTHKNGALQDRHTQIIRYNKHEH